MNLGLSFFTRDSAGEPVLVGRHPPHTGTWLWSIGLTRRQPYLKRILTLDTHRTGQWHDYLKLPFGWVLRVSQQDYHKRRK